MKKRTTFVKKILLVLTFIVLFTFTISLGTDNSFKSNKIILSAEAWKSNLKELDDYTDNTGKKYINIKNLLTLDSDGLVTGVENPATRIDDSTYILINDGLDLYYFSEICNREFSNLETDNPYYEIYLGCKYKLGADIDYEDASKTFKMLRPIGWEVNKPFKGEFDGNGFTISNIFYRPYDNEDEIKDHYANLLFLSWFSQNSGIIRNVGIINPNIIQYDIYGDAAFVTPFVGVNSGTIEYCFVQDLRGNEAGISAEGGYQIAMFATTNETGGTIKNCYVASSRISATSVTISDSQHRHPFITQNNSTEANAIENCYYDSQILSAHTTYDSDIIEGVTGITTAQFLDVNTFEYYDNDNNLMWYSNVTYPAIYATYFNITYPVLMGFDMNNEGYFLIKNAGQLSYMSQLIDKYQVFREGKYLLVNSVDLKTVKPNSFVFTQSVFKGIFKGGEKADDGHEVLKKDGTKSNKNSIINLSVEYGNSYQTYHCYGLFSVLSGTVENINIVHAKVKQNDLEGVTNITETNAVGTVCGMLDGGTIKDVDVYSDITLQAGSTNQFLGTEYVGSICGLIRSGVIEGSTASGTIQAPTYTLTGSDNSKTVEHSIGGLVGKITSNDKISNSLSNVNIKAITYNAQPGNNFKQYIGGVIGSGHLNNTFQLQNNANIIVGETGSSNYYSMVYVGGIVGLVSNATNSNGVYHNNGNIRYYVNDRNYKAYISGVMNVIAENIQVHDTFTATENYNTIQNIINNQTPFEFTSLTSGGTLHIENELSTSKYPDKYQVFATITNGIDIRAAGLVYSYLTNMNVNGAYNLDMHYGEWKDGKQEEVSNDAQSIDISMMDEFAPAFNADNQVGHANNRLHLDTNYIHSNANVMNLNANLLKATINLERVYNYRDVNYITKNIVNTYMLQLSGCINGRNFNLKNIRNDGEIKVYFEHNTHTNFALNQSTYYNYFGDYKKLKVYGVMEEVSLDHRAEDIYNGGNITVSAKSGVVPNFNLYTAGICYKNVGNDKPYADNDESDKPIMLEKGYIGSLHNCINNGEIRYTNGDIINNDNITAAGVFYGVSRAAGISCINSSTISQTFNLGNIYNINTVQTMNSTYGNYSAGPFEVETGGICFIMQNEQYTSSVSDLTSGNIIDSANNGIIVSMNMDDDNLAFTNAGGFVGRNDRGDDGELVNASNQNSSSSKLSHTTKIQYSINYGDIYAYNNYQSVEWSEEQQSKAAGFVCLGACSVINCINYGNIYGNSVSAGIFGYLYVSRMTTAGLGSGSPIYIANSINYGQVRVVEENQTNSENILNIGHNGKKVSVRDYSELRKETDNGTYIHVAGALIGCWANSNGTNEEINSLNIKYLVNFDDQVDMLGDSYDNYNNYIEAKQTMLENMATTKPVDDSPEPFGTNLESEYGIKCYTKDTALGNSDIDDIYSQAYNGGIFNENYSLRNPGDPILDEDGNIDLTKTDNFILDYIQFIPYSKVNDHLVEKIGLLDVVRASAWNEAINSENLIKTILELKYKGIDSELEDIYKNVINIEQDKLQENKIIILDMIEELITNGEINSEELNSIINILTNNGTDFSHLTSDSIGSIYSSILSDENILYSIVEDQNKTVLEVLYDYLLNNTDNFVQSDGSTDDPVNEILREFVANATTNEDRELIINIYSSLINNVDSLENYVKTLTESEKQEIANSIYDAINDNEEVIKAIGENYYQDLSLTTSDELNTLVQEIITNRRKGNLEDYPIKDSEYLQMYNDLYYSQYSVSDVENEIDGLGNNELTNFITALSNGISNSTSNLYQFIESGRLNSTNIYLPATAANHIAVVNNNGVYSTNTIAGNNEKYTGDYININGTNPNNVYSVLIVTGQYYSEASWYQTYNYYWTFNQNDSMFTGNRNTSIPNNQNFYGILTSNQTVSFNNGMQYFNTGVYATRETRQAGSNFNRYTIYDYSDIQIATYIDYAGEIEAKNNGNLTQSMLSSMSSILTSNQNRTTAKTYLKNLYRNSNSEIGKIEFLNLLFGTQNVNLDDALEYIEDTCRNTSAANVPNYSNILLSNISDNLAQGNIVKLFSNDNGSSYIEVLPEMLKVYGSNDYELIKELIVAIYQYRKGLNSSETLSISPNIKEIIESSTLTDNDKIGIVQNYGDESFQKYVLSYAISNHLINDANLANIFIELLNSDITQLKNENINQYLPKDLFSGVLSVLIKGNENLFKQYTELNSAETILDELTELGIDTSIITDNTGIYALASSHGILNGLFLPDNIELIKMDFYYSDEDNNLVNDPIWRGGTTDNPNYYDQSNTDCVNYKVYYEMKQLKKSIATIVFNMELVDATVDEYGKQLEYENILTNNTETDYFCNEKDEYGNVLNEIYFYVPINHNILSKPYIYIDMTSGSYELSYGATFDVVKDKFELAIPSDLSVGDVLSDTFVVQAEDITVKTTYTLYLVITKASYLDITDFDVIVDSVDAAYVTTDTTVEGSDVNTFDAVITTDVKGYNGVINLTYGTKNLINRFNLLPFVNVYSTSGTTIEDALTNKVLLTLDEQYKFNNVDNNGIVIVDGCDPEDTGYDKTTNGYGDGTVFFNLSLDNNMKYGMYLIEIALNNSTKYYVLFEKARSDNASLESLTYEGIVYNNVVSSDQAASSNNQSSMSIHRYGTVLTEEYLRNIEDGLPSYLDDLVIAPLATYTIGDIRVTNGTVKTYEIDLIITAENGKTHTFTHYITEGEYNTDIDKTFIDGGLDKISPDMTADTGYVYSSVFAKDQVPSYRFEYQLLEFYTTINSQYFKIRYYDKNGDIINDQATIELLETYYSINVIEGIGFEVSFYPNAVSQDYYFSLVYNNEVKFNNDVTLNWSVSFDIVKLKKLENTNSYFDNVVFLSESVVSSIRTMITVDGISIGEYQEMLEEPTRPIVSLPGKIHYNEYAIKINGQTITKEDDFYMIGLVSKTQLNYYTPTFTLPEGASVYRVETIGGIVYRYVPYYIDNKQELTTFLISEDGTSIRNIGGEVITATINNNTITYNDQVYNLSEVSGLQYVTVDGVTIENTTLRENYDEFGSYDEATSKFNYVTYRVYAEIYEYGDPIYSTKDYYTDYHIATQDLTNNIRFDIIIDYEDNCEIYKHIYNVYTEFSCYTLPEGVTEGERSDYSLYNRAGLFAYFEDGKKTLSHGKLQSNVSGYYGVYVALSVGYTYTFEVTDKGNTKSYVEGEEFLIASSVTARTVKIHITIKNETLSNDDWGVHVEDESFLKPLEENNN